MFETLESRAARLAQARADETARSWADRLAEAFPRGLRVESEGGWITISGEALEERLATSRALRLALSGLIDER